jgi:DNA-binding transcriptional LysR family regulator
LEAYAQLKFAMTDFQDKVNILSTSAVGTLRLGLLDHTLSEKSLPLIEVVQRFQKTAPEARVEIVQGIQSDLRVAVLEDRIDMAIGAFDTRSEAIEARWLYTERQQLYCGASHRFFDRAPDQVSRSEIETADWVKRGYSLGAHVTYPVEIMYATATAANIEAVALLILAGQHIGHLPEHFAHAYEETGQIRRISPETMSLNLDFFLISRKNRRDTSTMEVFRLAINETMP